MTDLRKIQQNSENETRTLRNPQKSPDFVTTTEIKTARFTKKQNSGQALSRACPLLATVCWAKGCVKTFRIKDSFFS